jgi:hypothetical protein
MFKTGCVYAAICRTSPEIYNVHTLKIIPKCKVIVSNKCIRVTIKVKNGAEDNISM